MENLKKYPQRNGLKKSSIYMDTKTFYRSANEIEILLDKYFIWNHKEEEIISFRAVHLKNIFGDFFGKDYENSRNKATGKLCFYTAGGIFNCGEPKMNLDCMKFMVIRYNLNFE